MTKDKALKMALEALEYCWSDSYNTNGYKARELSNNAITAIKEALAQPEQERPAPCARHCEATAFQITIKNLEAQLAQPKQEPVAWRFRSGTWFNREAHWRYINTLEGTEGLRGLEPLYTAPPQPEQEHFALKHRIAELEGAVIGLQAQLAQPEQEPVGWFGYDQGTSIWFETNKGEDNSVPLYTAPPQHTWVGLTDDEKLHIEIMGGKADVMLAEMVEAKLKEKNT